MALSDTAVRNAKPGEKQRKLSDEKGLYLLVHPNGGKYWRFKYRFGGKEKLLAFGTYPEVSLKEARARRDAAREHLASDIDPGELKKVQQRAGAERAANSFESVGREWYAKFAPTWSASHGERIIRRLERDIFPWIGPRPIAEVSAPELLAVLRRIEARGALETAHRAHQTAGRSSGMPSPPGGPSATRRRICAAPCRLPSLATTRLHY